MALEYLSGVWDWMQNQQIMEQLRGQTTPIVSSEQITPQPAGPAIPLTERPAPAAGRSGSVSAETRTRMQQRGQEIKKEEATAARARKAAKYKLAGQAIESAFPEEEPRPQAPGALTQPAGVPAPPASVPLPTIQALISGKPSSVAGLFGGY
jgi:hypothetical protein